MATLSHGTCLPSSTVVAKRLSFHRGLSVHRGQVYTRQKADTPPLGRRPCSWSDISLVRHPPGQTPPSLDRHPLPGQTSQGRYPQADTSQADSFPGRHHHPPPGRHPHQIATAAEGTYPTGMHSCFSTKNLHRIYLLMKDIKLGCTLHRHITISSAHKWNLQQIFHFSKE